MLELAPSNIRAKRLRMPQTIIKANLLADYFSPDEHVSHIPTLSSDPVPGISLIQMHVDGIYQLLSNTQHLGLITFLHAHFLKKKWLMKSSQSYH